MLKITDQISLDERELEERFVRASGPGGQNVNKVSTAVELRFDVVGSASLPEDVRARLARLAGRRLSDEGILVIRADRFRTQERNREDARERLAELIRKAHDRAQAPRTDQAVARVEGAPPRRQEEARPRQAAARLGRPRLRPLSRVLAVFGAPSTCRRRLRKNCNESMGLWPTFA